MSRVIVALTETGYSPIADNLYNFVESAGELPDDRDIIELFKTSSTMDEYGHAINKLFIDCAHRVLEYALPASYRGQPNDLIKVEVNLCEKGSSQDHFSVSFTGVTYQSPSSEDLDDLEAVIKNYGGHYLINNNIASATTYTLSVPYEVIIKIKDIDTDGICEPIVDCDSGDSTTHIIEIGYLRERVEQSGEWSDANDYYEGIWKIIGDYIPNFIDFKALKPDFLVLYAKSHD